MLGCAFRRRRRPCAPVGQPRPPQHKPQGVALSRLTHGGGGVEAPVAETFSEALFGQAPAAEAPAGASEPRATEAFSGAPFGQAP